MNELTERQARLHAFLCDCWYDPPTVREMAAFMSVHVSAIQCHLRALERKGFITMPKDRRSRGVQLLIGPDLTGTDVKIAGRVYRLVSTTEE